MEKPRVRLPPEVAEDRFDRLLRTQAHLDKLLLKTQKAEALGLTR